VQSSQEHLREQHVIQFSNSYPNAVAALSLQQNLQSQHDHSARMQHTSRDETANSLDQMTVVPSQFLQQMNYASTAVSASEESTKTIEMQHSLEENSDNNSPMDQE